MIHPRYKTFLILFVMLVQPVFTQVIRDVEISGNGIFTSGEYLDLIGFNSSINFYETEIDSVKSDIAGALASKGYFNPTFTKTDYIFSADSSNVTILIKLDEGLPAIIDRIVTDTVISQNGADFFSDLQGKVFNKEVIELEIADLLNHLEKLGYPFASVSFKSANLRSEENNFVTDLVLAVSPGRKAVIEKLLLEGNKITKPFVFSRAILFRPGEIFSEERLDEIRILLLKLNYFKQVKTPVFIVDSTGTGNLLISVEEKSVNSFDGIAGYVPPTGNIKGYFTGFINIGLRNIFGTGRATSIKWQQLNRSSQDIELKYFEPWIFELPLNLNLSFYQRKQDSTYIQRNFGVEANYLATKYITAGVLFETGATIPSLSKIVRPVYNSTFFTTGLSFSIDTRDDFLAPTSGLLFTNYFKYSSKKIIGPAELLAQVDEKNPNLQRYELNFEFYYSPLYRQTIALKIVGKELRGNQFEISDLYFLGGNNSLRGYREKQFTGNRVLWSNLEYRYFIENKSYIFTFFDMGYYLTTENENLKIPSANGFLTGYGAGISLDTTLGLFSVSYALGKGDSFSQGKIHIGVINEF